VDRGNTDKSTPDPGGEPSAATDRSLARFVLDVLADQDRPPSQQLRFGPYETIDFIGGGGQGLVYEAVDTRLNRRVALKVLRPGLIQSEQARGRLRREAEALLRLDHPGIAAAYDVGEAGGVPFIALRYVEGESLAEKIAAARERREARDSEAMVRVGSGIHTSPVDEVMLLFEKVARALHAAHELGVVHRDLKPANVLVAADGEPVVIDFGLARDLTTDGGSLTQSGEVLGTPAYMSPEQVRGSQRDIDARTDVYALGVALFECLTLRPPFEAATRDGLYRRILSSPAPKLRCVVRQVPRDLAVVVATTLEKDPDRRYQSALELAEDLARVRKREPILARPVGPAGRLLRWSQREPLVATLMGTVGLLLVALAAWSLHYAFAQRRLAEERRLLVVERTDFASLQVAESLRQTRMRRETEEQLCQALLGRATALRAARQPGYREEVWPLLRQALTLARGPDGKVRPEQEAEIRKQALACMGDFVGLQPVKPAGPRRAPPRPPVPPGARAVMATLGEEGPAIMAASEDGRRAVWCRESGRKIALLERTAGEAAEGSRWQASGWINSPLGTLHDLALNDDGARLLAACEQGLLVLDVPGRASILAARSEQLSRVCIQPGGHLAAALNLSRSAVELWDIHAGRSFARWPVAGLPANCAFDAGGTTLLVSSLEGEVSWVLPVNGTEERQILRGHAAGVTGLQCSPDGEHLASIGLDGAVNLFAMATGRRLAACRPSSFLQALDFSPDGRLLAIAGPAERLQVLDARSLALLASEGEPMDDRRTWTLHFDATGKRILGGGDSGIVAWEVHRDRDRVSLHRSWSIPQPAVYELRIAPRGQTAYLIEQRATQLKKLDLETRAVTEVTGAAAVESILALAFDPHGRTLSFKAAEGTVGLFHTGDGTVSRHGQDVFGSSTFWRSHSGRWFVGHEQNDDSLFFFDLERESITLRLPPEEADVWSARQSPDDSRIAVGLTSGSIAVWDLVAVRRSLQTLGLDVDGLPGEALAR
jgi:serine/threonine protein kinase/WD40 repeat protein